MMPIRDGYSFVDYRHEKVYLDAKRLLASEMDRQKRDADRMLKEFESYPEPLRREKIAWLEQHFAACKEPYIRILTDVLSIASPVIVVESVN